MRIFGTVDAQELVHVYELGLESALANADEIDLAVVAVSMTLPATAAQNSEAESV